MWWIEHLGSTEPFLDGSTGAPLWPRGHDASRNQMWSITMSYNKQNIPTRVHPASLDTGSVCTDLIDADCTAGRAESGLGDRWSSASTCTVKLCLTSGFELHQPCTQHGFRRALQASNSWHVQEGNTTFQFWWNQDSWNCENRCHCTSKAPACFERSGI